MLTPCVEHSHEELSVVAGVMQSFSNELSAPIAVKRICKKGKIIHPVKFLGLRTCCRWSA